MKTTRMITMEKFFKALEFIKAGGRFSLGLIIAESKSADLTVLERAHEKILADGAAAPEAVIKKICEAFAGGKWIILEIINALPAEIYGQLKLLSAINRMQFADGTEIRQPEESRVVVVAGPKTVKKLSTEYPDFIYLFGPVITI